MEKDDFLKLYENTVDEEHYYFQAHHDRIAFYWGLITAIIAATGAGSLQASEWYHFAVLCVGPILLFIVSANAIAASYRVYQRVLETITVRAKIEQELGLTKELQLDDATVDSYWISEPFIPRRHIESRKRYESSAAFVEAFLGKGYQRVSVLLLRGIQGVSCVMSLGFIALAIWAA